MKEEIKTTISNVTSCKLGDNHFSLGIEVNNSHVDLNSHAYTLTAGNRSSFVIYDMTPELMYELANMIIGKANEISKRGL